jgi:hypothetical protein
VSLLLLLLPQLQLILAPLGIVNVVSVDVSWREMLLLHIIIVTLMMMMIHYNNEGNNEGNLRHWRRRELGCRCRHGLLLALHRDVYSQLITRRRVIMMSTMMIVWRVIFIICSASRRTRMNVSVSTTTTTTTTTRR